MNFDPNGIFIGVWTLLFATNEMTSRAKMLLQQQQSGLETWLGALLGPLGAHMLAHVHTHTQLGIFCNPSAVWMCLPHRSAPRKVQRAAVTTNNFHTTHETSREGDWAPTRFFSSATWRPPNSWGSCSWRKQLRQKRKDESSSPKFQSRCSLIQLIKRERQSFSHLHLCPARGKETHRQKSCGKRSQGQKKVKLNWKKEPGRKRPCWGFGSVLRFYG